MRAFHSFWSAPNRARNGGDVAFSDHELLTLMLSALEWRRHNGEIAMITDRAGAAYFARAGLSALWSEPPAAALDSLALDPFFFWAAGKLEALRLTPAPCVMLDTDLIVWRDVGALLGDRAVAAHREALDPAVYPDPFETFPLAPDYAFPAAWDFSLPAANTAFLYLPREDLKARYTAEAFRFMAALRPSGLDPTVTMCFAEQRVFPMCAAAEGVGVDTLLDVRAADEQELVTHLWGFKRALSQDAARRAEYCIGCAARILTDFPEWEGVLAANPQTGRYVRAINSGGGMEV